MFGIDTDQIETLTGAANDQLRAYFKLFGFAETDAPTLTPVMVMAAIEAGKGVLPAPEPAAVPTMRVQPAPKAQFVDAEARRRAITAELHRLAKNGYGPTMGEWDRLRTPGLPTSGAVVKHMGAGWLELMETVGLQPQMISRVGAARIVEASRQMVAAAAPAPQPEAEPEPAPVAALPTPPTAHNEPNGHAAVADLPGPPTAQIVPQNGAQGAPRHYPEPNGHGAATEVAVLLTKPPRTLATVDAEQAQRKADLDAETRRTQYREILAELQSMAVGNTMPTMQVWDQNKPAHLPTGQGVLLRYGLDGWGELADRARLTYLGKGKRPPAPRKGA